MDIFHLIDVIHVIFVIFVLLLLVLLLLLAHVRRVLLSVPIEGGLVSSGGLLLTNTAFMACQCDLAPYKGQIDHQHNHKAHSQSTFAKHTHTLYILLFMRVTLKPR
jgi:hypothetical protein